MGPDMPPQKNQGKMTCRSLGGLWFLTEGQAAGPDGELWSSIITLGYDPKQQRYIGSFIASMMTHLWHYSGVLTGNRLVLDTEGPKFDGSGMGKYRDIIEIIDKNHWKLSSEMLLDDGRWQAFMSSDNRRISS